jgi:ubiquinone/menaquinone biosynthesis C-methylase UbiE
MSKTGERQTSTSTLRGFSDVDRSSNPHALVAYLDWTNTDSFVRASKRKAVEALAPNAGERILDVGCGLGHIALDVVRFMGGTGRVTAIDNSEIMVREARRRMNDENGEGVAVVVGNAHHMSFNSHTFDGCLIINTLMHCARPQVVLSEVKRVLKPHGRFVVLEPDWQTLALSTGDPLVDDSVVTVVRQSLTNSTVGHQLPSLIQNLGFCDIAVSAGTIITREYSSANRAWKIRASIEHAQQADSLPAATAATMRRVLSKSSRTGCFHGSMKGYLVTGRKADCDKHGSFPHQP